MQIRLFGIPNCNSVKKARDWLTENSLDYTFHDFKKQGITEEMIHSWLKHVPLNNLVNRKGTTWRMLSDHEKEQADQEPGAINLMLQKPSVIKRPVVVTKNKVLVGFDTSVYEQIFSK